MLKINLLSVLKPLKIKATHCDYFDYVGKTKLLKVSNIYKFLHKNTDLDWQNSVPSKINSSTIVAHNEHYYNRITCYENIYDFLSVLPDEYIALRVTVESKPFEPIFQLDHKEKNKIDKSKLCGDLYTVTLSGHDIMLLDPEILANISKKRNVLPDYQEQQWLINNVPSCAVERYQIVHVKCGETDDQRCITVVNNCVESSQIVISAMVITKQFAKYLSNRE